MATVTQRRFRPFRLIPPTILAGLAALILTACTHQCEPSPAPAQADRLFGISIQTLNNPFFLALNDGIGAAVTARGGHVVTMDAQFSSLKQKEDVIEFLRQRPAAVFLNPVNWEGSKALLIEARRLNVPIIVVDTPISEPDLALCQVVSDNVEAGRMACEALAAAHADARVVVLHMSLNRACIDRVAGFTAAMAKHPGMRILDVQEGRGTFDGGQQAMGELLLRFPDLTAAFCVNDPSALGCISALEGAAKAGQVSVVSVDGSREVFPAIANGTLLSTSAQDPTDIGRIAVENAFAHLDGKPCPKEIRVPVRLITRANLRSVAESR